MTITRDMLQRAFPNDVRLQSAFEELAATVEKTAAVAGVNVADTEALNDATVITLSRNAALNNERVLKVGPGIEAFDDGEFLTLQLSSGAASVQGGYGITLVAQGETSVLLPTEGTLATLDGGEALANKSLLKPLLGSWGNFANDAAAAGGGVPVAGVYRNGSAVMVRVA